MKKLNYVILFIFILSATDMLADHRNFVWTYQYMTMEPGKTEFELYHTLSATDPSHFETTGSNELNMEFEIGMTPHFDFAIYQVFQAANDGKINYGGFKLRSRYKIGNKNDFWLDPLIYLEYSANANFTEQEIEPKLILAKDIGNFKFSFNPYLSIEKGKGEWEFEPNYAFGACYEVSKLFGIGLEAKGNKDGNYIGPTISHGSEKAWFSFSVVHSIGTPEATHPKLQARLILGLEL